jgi:hypothetical protein
MRRLQPDHAGVVGNAERIGVENDRADRGQGQHRDEIDPVKYSLRSIPDTVLGQFHESCPR